MALLQLEPIPSNRTERPPYPMVICVWRVPDGLHERVEAVTGKPIGADFPYAAPGWEAESDAKEWISDVSHEELPQVAHGWQHGTPEMLQSMVANYRLCAVERVGDWPKLEFINDDERILSAALAGSPLGGTERPNRNSYRATVTPAVAPSWKMGVEGFLRFIAFEPAWGSAAAGYLATSRHTFERSMAIRNVAPAAVLAVLNPDPLFDLLGEPRPAGDAGVLDRMAREELIVSDLQGGYDVTNLAVLALARDLAPVPALARKAVRIVRYRGTDKLETLEEHAAPVGYAGGFQAILRSLLAMVPSHEEVVGGVRRSIPMIPELALREVLANALVHQDLTTMGAGPLIEVYTDRIEVTNPGEPLVEPDRLLDAPPRSRNEALASLMRRLGICEERGSGIDKIVASIERLSLPPPLFRGAAGSTVVTLFAERPFQRMSQDERIRACYQHACLHYAAADPMSNTSLRERLGLGQGQHPQASLVIRAAIEAGRIKPLAEDQARRNARYIPFWA
jgi:predicted HTH transcriptional regulator